MVVVMVMLVMVTLVLGVCVCVCVCVWAGGRKMILMIWVGRRKEQHFPRVLHFCLSYSSLSLS